MNAIGIATVLPNGQLRLQVQLATPDGATIGDYEGEMAYADAVRRGWRFDRAPRGPGDVIRVLATHPEGEGR